MSFAKRFAWNLGSLACLITVFGGCASVNDVEASSTKPGVTSYDNAFHSLPLSGGQDILSINPASIDFKSVADINFDLESISVDPAEEMPLQGNFRNITSCSVDSDSLLKGMFDNGWGWSLKPDEHFLEFSTQPDMEGDCGLLQSRKALSARSRLFP